MKTKEEQLKEILKEIWTFAPGLNKHTFDWRKTPKSIVMLAATDSSALLKFQGTEYYVNYVWKTDSIEVEVNR